MKTSFSIAALGAVLCVSSIASAAEPDKKKEEMPEERASIGAALAPDLPVGNFANAFVFGIGATVNFDYAVHPHVQIIGRTGYVHHLPKSGLDVSLGALPIWGGARYTFGIGEGAYLEGNMGPTILFARATVNGITVSDSDTKFATSLGGGYRVGKLDVGARLIFWDLGHASDSMALMATAGFTFASF
jgi:hypothetical protein